MKVACLSSVALLVLLVAAPASAVPINAALGRPVTITGAVGVITCCWPDSSVYPPAPLSSITDGVFRPASTEWQDGTVWWDEVYPGSLNNVVEIDLQGQYLISELVLQADNNDFYGISLRNPSGIWGFIGSFGTVPGFGMQTRDVTGLSLIGTGFRIDPFGGDAWYSVSEFQAIGTPIPEPTTLLLLGSGISALARRRQRRG